MTRQVIALVIHSPHDKAMTTTAPSVGLTGDTKLLRTVLRENATFCMASGAVLAAGSAALDNWVGVRWWILLLLGLGLIAYAPSLWIGAGRPKLLRQTGLVAIAGDVGWIVGAVVIVAATDWLTRNGEIALIAVTALVASFAIGQAVGLRRLNP